MNVNDHLVNAKAAQPGESDLQHGTARDLHQRFGAIVGERTEPGAETGGQDHGFHRPCFSISTCRTATSRPLRPRKRLANCSAKYTERCCPPVQPKDTIRFLKPRF